MHALVASLLLVQLPVPPQAPPVVCEKPAVVAAAPQLSPPLVIHVWPNRSCPAGNRALDAILPKLADAKWIEGKHYRVVKSYDGPCPVFLWKGKPFSRDGWQGWEQWNDELRSVMRRPAAVSVPVVHTESELHSHRCDSCGTVWWHSGTQAAQNPRSHNCPRCGREQYVVHSWANAGRAVHGPITP